MSYLIDKKIFELRLSELKNINEFDMIKFKEENQELEEIINLLIIGISKGAEKHFAKLSIIEKEELLKNLFIENEEDLSTEENQKEEIEETPIQELMEEDQVEVFEID